MGDTACLRLCTCERSNRGYYLQGQEWAGWGDLNVRAAPGGEVLGHSLGEGMDFVGDGAEVAGRGVQSEDSSQSLEH